MGKNKVSKIAQSLDLSTPDLLSFNTNTAEFEVQDYDYDKLQKNDDAFANDLAFLLGSGENIHQPHRSIDHFSSVELSTKPEFKGNGSEKTKLKKASVKEIIELDIDFSFEDSSEDESVVPNKTNSNDTPKSIPETKVYHFGNQILTADAILNAENQANPEKINKKKSDRVKQRSLTEIFKTNGPHATFKLKSRNIAADFDDPIDFVSDGSQDEASENSISTAKEHNGIGSKISANSKTMRGLKEDKGEEDQRRNNDKSVPDKYISKIQDNKENSRQDLPIKPRRKEKGKKESEPKNQDSEISNSKKRRERRERANQRKIAVEREMASNDAPYIESNEDASFMNQFQKLSVAESIEVKGKKNKKESQSRIEAVTKTQKRREQRKRANERLKENDSTSNFGSNASDSNSSFSEKALNDAAAKVLKQSSTAQAQNVKSTTQKFKSNKTEARRTTEKDLEEPLTERMSAPNSKSDKSQAPDSGDTESQNSTHLTEPKFPETFDAVPYVPGSKHPRMRAAEVYSYDRSDEQTQKIVSSSSKESKRALEFAFNNTELFESYDNRRALFLLVVNISLYGSKICKSLIAKYPVMEKFYVYEELMAPDGVRFDYSFLAYIGHVLLWYANLQREEGYKTIMKEYQIKYEKRLIFLHLGGWTLWSTLKRDKISLSRWNRISKHRERFSLEEDQFVLIIKSFKIPSMS